jgi:putative nucleotidyltransferase with HDIG domain
MSMRALYSACIQLKLIRSRLTPLYSKLKSSHHTDYIGEPVTQLEHFVLAAQTAEKHHPQDIDLITGTFLHDIGHQLDTDTTAKMKDPVTGEVLGLHNHDQMGAQYLSELGFSDKVVGVVRNHVTAKRFMATVGQAQYLQKLSPASLKTFELQGGFLNKGEMATFRADPYFHESLLVRGYDNAGKDRAQLLRPIHMSLDYYFNLAIFSILRGGQSQ